MELSSVNLFYKLLLLYLFLCLFITSTKSQLNYFNYTETKLGDQNTPPLVADIKTYDDGTILVHIVRNKSTSTTDCSNVQGMSLEQQLHIRVILRNGTVKEIDPDLKLDLINYCLFNNTNTKYEINKNNNIIIYLKDKNNNTSILRNIVNPISIYPLQKPFILVTYVNATNSSNPSDPTTYMEWGAVIDWDGKTRSLVPFPGFWIDSIIQPNANNKFGFLRFSIDVRILGNLRQYSSDDSGNLTVMNDVDSYYSYQPITIVSTLNNGYLAFYNDTVNNNDNNSLLRRGGLYVQIISYNDSERIPQGTYAYQISQPNMTINSAYCDTFILFGYYIDCIVSVNSNNTTRYISVWLRQSGLSLSFSPSEIYNLPNVTGLSHQGWRAKIMPFGGYILGLTAYDDNDDNTYHYIYAYDDLNNTQIPLKSPSPFLTNYFGVNVIMNNNTVLLASQYTTDNASWSLLTIQLPFASVWDDVGYDNIYIRKTSPPINANVNSSTTILNITFLNYVTLSAGNITIYKVSDNSVRQRVSATMNEFCKIDDYSNVIIKVINSTFNEYGEQYFVTIDNNFVKGNDGSPQKGIHDGIWILKTEDRKIYLDEVVMGSVRLTVDASKTFLAPPQNNKSEYINNLLNEIANKVPINSSGLKSNKSKNYRFHKVSDDKIVISIRIDMINEKRNASEIFSDLNTMIVYKNITTFSSGVTNDLDESYGFKTLANAWNENKILILVGIAIYIIICLLVRILSYKSKSQKIEAISSAILRLGLIIPNFILTILFVVNYSKDAELYWQSVLVLSVSLFTNICIAIYTIYKGIKEPVIGEDFKKWVKKYLGLVIPLIILIATDYEYLTILKDIPMFTKRLYRYEEINRFNILKHIFVGPILCGAFFDIFFRNIPQIVVQAFYYNELNNGRLFEYNIVPLLLLVTSCLKIFIIIFNYVFKVVTLVLIRRDFKYNFYGKCTKCKRSYTSPTWCQQCDPQDATEGWTSENKNIDDYIKNFQINVTEYENMVEWIPYDRLINLQKVKEDESEIIFMATWKDGIRIIKGEILEYKRLRIGSCGVNLKMLHGSQSCDFFIKELTNYMQSNGNVVYGITKNTETNQYIIVIPDEFGSRRNDSNGKCIYCEHYNTSPAWCQSCDPWKATQEWTSGNEEIDNFIKEFQFKTTEYEKVIEWIPFDKLIDLQEINEESDLEFTATWVNGVRIIKGDPGKHMQSRIISSVDLMKLNCSQTDTLELFENFKNHMQLGKYRIHGITQNTETGQYMIVIDFYSDKRNFINGNCKYCNRYNTSPAWCQLCDPRKVDQEASGDKNIDDCIKEFQLKATAFENVIEWIPFNRLKNIKVIGQGGFGTVYSSIWLDGNRMVEGNNNLGHVRYRNKSCEVALKTMAGSHKSSSEFLNEFKHHMQCRLEGSALEVYGLTRHTETGQYMMVYQYANRGNLHDFLDKYFRELVWKNKLKQLADISYDLSRIHKAGLIHNDFHSGNILLNQNIGGDIKSYITDLGLSRKPGDHDSKEGIYGVMPYVAPEILLGQKYTREADIYGLGVMMAEVSTGKCPYDGYKFDTKLATKICKGLRPDFVNGTPDCYIELAKKCMDPNPQNRPSAEYVNSKIKQWKKIIESENLMDKEELDIKKKFIDADNEIKETTLKSLSMLQTKYCSTLIDVQEIIKSLKVSTQFSPSISQQIASSTLELPSNITDLLFQDSELQKE